MMKPRIAAERLADRAFSKSLDAILSLMREPLPPTMADPIVRTTSAIGRGWYAKRPGNQVGRVAIMMVEVRIPMARLTELHTSAIVAARRISVGASFRA
jgi:hypothetical protein